MESPEEFRQRVQQEKPLAARLRLATTRLEDAQQERIWAIAAASEAGLSIRQIAAATDLSPSRVHQLLNAQLASEIPIWLSKLREPNRPDSETDEANFQTTFRQQLSDEVEVFRWCINWLERLERGEDVVVNLRPDTEPETEFVRFDYKRVLQVLSRIAADLEELARISDQTISEEVVDQEDSLVRHRRRLAEPEPEPKHLSQREERVALREKLGLTPS